MYKRMYFTGYQSVGNVFKSRWLCSALLLVSVLALPERSEAMAIDQRGTGDEACFHFKLWNPDVTSTRIVSSNRTEYHLTATGQAGRSGCPGWIGPYTMRVAASWDVSSHTASEQIEHGDRSSTLYIVTHIQAKCDKDPWMYYASCSLISAGTTPSPDGSSRPTFEGPYPVSAAALPKAKKEALAGLEATSKGFILPPRTPPIIESPGQNGVYRNTGVTVAIRHPNDANDGWQAEHPEFDVEFKVNRTIGEGVLTMIGWEPVSPDLLLGRSTLTTTPVDVEFTKQVPGKPGEEQRWLMRARVHTAALVPWSDWRPFNVVVPKAKLGGSGGPPPAGAARPAPGKGTVPMHDDPKASIIVRASFFDVSLPNGAKARGQIVGKKLMLGGDAGKQTPAPDGVYKTGDGKSVVVQGGIVATGSNPGPPDAQGKQLPAVQK